MSGFMGVLLASASGGVQNGIGFGVTNTSPATGLRSGSITLVSDGTSTKTPQGGGSAVAGPSWYAPTTTSIGSSYWCKFVPGTYSTTTITGSSVNAVISVSGSGWTFQNTATNNEGFGNAGTLYFYSDAGGTNLVATNSVTWDVGYTP